MNEQEMTLLNDDKRVERIESFEINLNHTVLNGEKRHFLDMSDDIVIDKALAGEINKLSVQYLDKYPDIDEFTDHIEEMIKDNLLHCYAYFRDEYSEEDVDNKGNFVTFNEVLDTVQSPKQVLN